MLIAVPLHLAQHAVAHVVGAETAQVAGLAVCGVDAGEEGVQLTIISWDMAYILL